MLISDPNPKLIDLKAKIEYKTGKMFLEAAKKPREADPKAVTQSSCGVIIFCVEKE